MPLNPTNIKQALIQLDWTYPIEFVCFETIPSTNDYFKHHTTQSTYCVCLAEKQTQGRGRLGRVWHSPEGGNLYFSMRLTLMKPLSYLGPLSLITGLSLLSTLKTIGLHAPFQLKWPNDLLLDNKKVGGILIEVLDTQAHATSVVIGIGLNITACPSPIDEKTATSLHLISQLTIDRNQLIANLINRLTHQIQQYTQLGWEPFEEAWHHVDFLYNKNITVTQTGKQQRGRACGVNTLGQLILQDETGLKHALSSGDTTCQHLTRKL